MDDCKGIWNKNSKFGNGGHLTPVPEMGVIPKGKQPWDDPTCNKSLMLFFVDVHSTLQRNRPCTLGKNSAVRYEKSEEKNGGSVTGTANRYTGKEPECRLPPQIWRTAYFLALKPYRKRAESFQSMRTIWFQSQWFQSTWFQSAWSDGTAKRNNAQEVGSRP